MICCYVARVTVSVAIKDVCFAVMWRVVTITAAIRAAITVAIRASIRTAIRESTSWPKVFLADEGPYPTVLIPKNKLRHNSNKRPLFFTVSFRGNFF